MRTFTLRLEADATQGPRSIEFVGLDAHQAFVILAREPERRQAAVWEGATCLGSVLRTGKDSWEFASQCNPIGT